MEAIPGVKPAISQSETTGIIYRRGKDAYRSDDGTERTLNLVRMLAAGFEAGYNCKPPRDCFDLKA